MKTRTSTALAILAAALLTAACSMTDTGITTAVKSKMAVDRTVKAYQIEVTTRNGVVTLTGNIDDPAAKDRALQIARETKGVKHVEDMIEVRTAAAEGEAPSPDRTIGETIDDAGTTMRVKSKLLEDELVRGTKIDVDTREGVVFLTGTVRSEQEKDQAVKLARDTKGVKDVQANLIVRSRT